MNYSADQKHTDTYCSEQDLADRLGVTLQNLRTMITDGSVPPGDVVISNGDGVEHCYTEETTVDLIMNSHKINPTQNKETRMSTSNTNSKRKLNKLSHDEAGDLKQYLIENFDRFSPPNVSWAEVRDVVKKELNINISEGSAQEYMKKAANKLNTILNVRSNSKAKLPTPRKTPSAKAGAGTVVLEDGTIVKITIVGRTEIENA